MTHMSTQQTYTTAQAAQSLGVTDSRVRQILLEARAIGRKHGTAWILTIDDIHRIGLKLGKKTKTPLA
jgi:DNA-directed RNA polymerase sigma subunit (sigma70/sigma32)